MEAELWNRAHLFQSAPPVKGATALLSRIRGQCDVSIRAPREGGDISAGVCYCRRCGFNPRPP